MADQDDWRAERAAKLAGTPFARPPRSRSDDTLPVGSVAPVVVPPVEPARAAAPRVAPASPPSPALGRWLPLAGVGAALIAAGVWLFDGHEERAAAPVAVQSASRIAAATGGRPVTSAPVATALPAELVTAPVPATQPVAVASPSPPITAAQATRDETIVTIPAPKLRHAAADKVRPDHPRRSVETAATRPVTHAAPDRPHPTGVASLPAVTMPTPRCTPAAGRIASLVCASPMLSALDRQERELRAGVVADGDPRLVARADKDDTAFLNRRERCKDATCLRHVYDHRIGALQKMRTKIASARARAARRALPVCAKGQKPSPTTCRQHGLLKRLFGG